jgi:hypothetical protein
MAFSPLHSPSISPVSPLLSPVIRPVSGVSSPTGTRISREHNSGRVSPLLPSTSSISLLNLSFSQTSISESDPGITTAYSNATDTNGSSPAGKRVLLTSSLSPPNTSRYVNTLQQSRISHYFSTGRRTSSSAGLESTTEELVPDSPNLKPMSLGTSPSRLVLGDTSVSSPIRSPNRSPLRSPGSPTLGPVTPVEEPMTPIVLGD